MKCQNHYVIHLQDFFRPKNWARILENVEFLELEGEQSDCQNRLSTSLDAFLPFISPISPVFQIHNKYILYILKVSGLAKNAR